MNRTIFSILADTQMTLVGVRNWCSMDGTHMAIPGMAVIIY